jgi:Carboxypeptidase regulatory-like domain
VKRFAHVRTGGAGVCWSTGVMAVCVWAVLAGLGAAGAQLPPQPHLTTLSGTVFKADDTLADGGRVTIETADGRVPQATAVDSSGHFMFTRLRSGTYNVRAYYKGQWSEWQRNVIVRHNRVTEITLHVAPVPVEKPKK